MSMQIKIARAQTQGSGRVMPGVGDPGFFGDVGSFFGGVAKRVAKSVPGPVGAIARELFPNGGGQMGPPRPGGGIATNGMITTFQEATRQVPTPGVGGTFERFFPGGKSGFTEVAVNGGCAAGHRPNKTDYFLNDGTFVQKGSRCVKIRRRNPLNPKALDRAIGRIVSAKAKETKLKRITIRKKC